MRFYTALIAAEEEVLVAFREGGRVYRLKKLAALAPSLAVKDMEEVIRRWSVLQGPLEAMSRAEDVLTAAATELDEMVLLAPLPRPKQDIICLGINYEEHAEEADKFSSADFGGQRPATIYFSKRVNEAVAPGGVICGHAPLVDSLDYECELAVVLGRDCYGVSEAEALDYVFGYTILNDVSARNLQTRHKQWYLGKSLDGFTPHGSLHRHRRRDRRPASSDYRKLRERRGAAAQQHEVHAADGGRSYRRTFCGAHFAGGHRYRHRHSRRRGHGLRPAPFFASGRCGGLLCGKDRPSHQQGELDRCCFRKIRREAPPCLFLTM